MFGARTFVALALACALVPASPSRVAADAPVPLDYKAYDGWSSIRTPKVSDDGKHLAYALTPKDEPAPQLPAASLPAPSGSGSPAPSPSPSGSPAPKADKTKDTGSTLTIRDLAGTKRVTATDATDFAVSDDDRFVAYATETKNGKTDGLHVYDVAKGTTTAVLTGEGRYRDLAIARDGSSLAFLSDVATYKDDVPHDALYVVDLRAAKLAAVKAVDGGTSGLTANTTPNANGKLRYSRENGRRTLIRKRAVSADLSPGGRYVLEWDEGARHWYALRTADGKRVELAPKAGVPFHQVDDDHPAPPQPYGWGGWLAGDRGVMLYDEYDVWLANPDTGAATNLTRGAGRRTRTAYSPVQTDPDATAFAADKPLLL